MDTKQWIGDKHSVFVTLGASNHTDLERQNVDYYATDPKALNILLNKLKEDNIILPKNIVEPCCGGGHLSEELKRHGYNVTSYDLYNHGYDCIKQDFLKSEIIAQCFLTNPPYKYALEFTQKALKNVLPNGYVVMLLRIQFLEGKARNLFFKKYPPKFIYINSSRQNCARNGDFITSKRASATCYAWFIWQKGFQGEPILRWID